MDQIFAEILCKVVNASVYPKMQKYLQKCMKQLLVTKKLDNSMGNSIGVNSSEIERLQADIVKRTKMLKC